MATPYDIPQNFSTTLNVPGGIDSSQTSGIILTSVTGLPTDGGVLCFDWASTLDTTVAEYIEYTGISGNTLTGVTRGQEGLSAKAHSNGAVIAGVISRMHIKRTRDKLTGNDATAVQDPNGNEIIKTSYNASAVNEVTVTNAVTSNGPTVSATGNDTNIDLNINSKGTGSVKINGTALNISNDGWTSLTTASLTYSSADGHTFVVTTSADCTSILQKGDRIKFTNNSTTFYGFITKLDATTLTLYGGTTYSVANSAITSPYYSHHKSPYGFNNDPTIWTESTSDSSDRTQGTAAQNAWYNINSLSLAIPIGIWRVVYDVVAWMSGVNSSQHSTTLSTANNTESDTDFTFYFVGVPNTSNAGGLNRSREKTLVLTAKTTYYLNTMTPESSTPTLHNDGAKSPTRIKAICAYL